MLYWITILAVGLFALTVYGPFIDFHTGKLNWKPVKFVVVAALIAGIIQLLQF